MCPFAIAAALRVPLLSGDSVVKVRPLALLSRVPSVWTELRCR